ncbi:PR domain zinc finger protein 5 [Elysia marginata]|uniref:PR domain zinc finger protein 5 n=1 Tax=Elysia marginata TaxID=1093978 RepID=A0AAV4GR21_9GAST|nr:PR domain zinc finger protein 5 [Elysia marginata]
MEQQSISSNSSDGIPVENAASLKAHAAWSPGSGLSSCSLCLQMFPSEAALHNHVSASHRIALEKQRQGLQGLTHSQMDQGSVWVRHVDPSKVREKSVLTGPVSHSSGQPLNLNTQTELLHHIQRYHSGAFTNPGQKNPRFSKDVAHQNQQMLHAAAAHFPNPSGAALHNHPCTEHVCDLCLASFPDYRQLELHLQISHKSSAKHQKYQRTGPGLVSLIKPRSRFNSDSQRSLLANYLLCSKCNTAHRDRSSLLCHTLKVHPELNQLNVCRLCDRLFNNSIALHRHLKKAHGLSHSGTVKCPFCPAWLPSMEMASIHRITLHTGALPVHCPFCGAGFQGMHGMYNHVRLHHLQTEAHVCPECQATFISTRALSEHARKVHGMTAQALRESLHSSNNATYCCPFCSTALSRTYELAMHVINAHSDHLLPKRCHICLQAFVSDPILKIHLAGAHGLELEDAMEGVDVVEEEVDEEDMEEEEVRRRFLQQQQQQQNQHNSILQHQQQQQSQHHHIQQGHQQNQHYIFQQQQHQDQQHYLLQQQQQYLLQQQQQPSAISQFEDFERSPAHQVGADQARIAGEDREFSHQSQHSHSFEEQDILETQEAGRFLEELQEQQTNTLGCLDETNQVLSIPIQQDSAAGQLFPSCSSLDDEVQLLGSHSTNFNLSSVDYLETLTNDSIAVGADVVAAADAASKSQILDGQDPFELSYQFEIDGVLYQLASSMGNSDHQEEFMDTASAITEGLAHLLQ